MIIASLDFKVGSLVSSACLIRTYTTQIDASCSVAFTFILHWLIYDILDIFVSYLSIKLTFA